MEKAVPTRKKLLSLRAEYGVIEKGLELLKLKREALMKEFFDIVDEAIGMREELNALLNSAQKRLEEARAFDETALKSFVNASKREVSLGIRIRNVWGVLVPEVEELSLVRSIEDRDLSLIGERVEFFDIAADFERITDLLVKIASREARLQRVGDAIKADTRKINAISEVMLPTISSQIRTIERVLDERERETVFRLKRFKRTGE